LATESLSSHIGQRIRWARGMCQILRTDNPLTRRKLRFGQRLCYFNAMFHFLYSVPRLIFLTAPLVYLLLGHRSIRGYSLTIFAFGLPHIVLSTLCSSRSQGKFRYSFWNEVYEAVLSPYILVPTIMALINPRLGTFNVTAKGGLVPESYFDWKIARPYLVLLFLNVLGLIFAVPRFLWWHDQPGTIAMNAFWTLFNVVVLAACCSIAYEREQKRSHVRVPLVVPVQVQLKDQRWVAAQSTDISNGGVALRGTVCPAGGHAAGLPGSAIVQTDDLSGGETTTTVPLLEGTAPASDAEVYGAFRALAQTGVAGSSESSRRIRTTRMGVTSPSETTSRTSGSPVGPSSTARRRNTAASSSSSCR